MKNSKYSIISPLKRLRGRPFDLWLTLLDAIKMHVGISIILLPLGAHSKETQHGS